jgi:hypothetical protein
MRSSTDSLSGQTDHDDRMWNFVQEWRLEEFTHASLLSHVYPITGSFVYTVQDTFSEDYVSILVNMLSYKSKSRVASEMSITTGTWSCNNFWK